MYLSAGLLPLYDLHTTEKKKTIWLGEHVVKEGIKWPTHDRVWEAKAREASALLKEGVDKFADRDDEADRAEMGEWNGTGITSEGSADC